MNPSDLPKSVTEIARYFALPLLQLLAIAGILASAGRIDVSGLIARTMRGLFATDNAELVALLRDTDLLKLLPVLAMFLFLLLLVGLKRFVAALAQLLPPQLTLHRHVLIARLANPQHTLSLWNSYPTLDVHSVLATIEEQLLRLRAARTYGTSIAGDAYDYWTEGAAFFMRGVDTFKVLGYFTMATMLIGVTNSTEPSKSLLYGAAVLVLLILSATIALAQSLNCTFQSIGVLSNFWSASDSVWTPGDEVSTTQERVDALTGVAVARWWGWQLTKVGFVDFWDILRGGAVQDAAKMNNTDT